jgi:hypothetical protein
VQHPRRQSFSQNVSFRMHFEQIVLVSVTRWCILLPFAIPWMIKKLIVIHLFNIILQNVTGVCGSRGGGSECINDSYTVKWLCSPDSLVCSYWKYELCKWRVIPHQVNKWMWHQCHRI